MEGVLAHVVERLSNSEVLFGLAVRFFGVFIVLGIVMMAIYILGRVFVEIEKAQGQAASPDDTPEGPPAAVPVAPTSAITPPASAAPDEVAVALALSMVPDEAAAAVALALSVVPDEAAVAVTLALNEAVEARSAVPHLSPQTVPSRAWEEPGSAWKLLGRQQALFRKTSLTRDITPRGE